MVYQQVSKRHQLKGRVNECLELYRPLRTNPRSNADPFRLTFTMTRSKAGDHTFTVTAALVWNENTPILNLLHQWMCLKRFSKHTSFLIDFRLLFCLYNV